jgi:integrase
VGSLREHRLRQLEERLAWGEGWTDTGLVFTKEDGSAIRPSWVTRRLPQLAEKAGLPRLTPHSLRHGWATMALEAGVHPKVVADRLGHASVQITLDRYSHVTEGLDREAAETVANLIEGTRR